MEWIVRRLDNAELDAALSLAWKTYLEFEAPDYSPEGVATFKRDIIENAAFRNDCLLGKNRIWGAFDFQNWSALLACVARATFV